MRADQLLYSALVVSVSGEFSGAGEGNRTLVISLEGYGSTIELHPHSPVMNAYRPELNRIRIGAGEEVRTPDFHLGKVTLYH